MQLSLQNTDNSLLLLAAQDRLYAKAKSQIWLLYLSTAIPFLAFLLSPFLVWLDNNWLLISGGAGLALSLAMEAWTGRLIDKAAKIQETFDLNVYEIPENTSLTGEKIKPDEVLKAAGSYRLAESRLPWYSSVIEQVKEPSVQVLLCQRENAMWDWRARIHVATALNYILWILVALTIGLGIFKNTDQNTPYTVMQWLSLVVVPAFPLLLKTWQLQQSFAETGKAREALDNDILQEIEAYKNTRQAIPDERLRTFQDRIHKSRTKNCIVPDWLHSQLKKGLQPMTTKATEMLVKEINQTA